MMMMVGFLCNTAWFVVMQSPKAATVKAGVTLHTTIIALRIDSDNQITGIHDMNQYVRQVLQDKHPDAEESLPAVLDNGEALDVEAVIFEAISSKMVQKAAQHMSGSGGPTQIDVDG